MAGMQGDDLELQGDLGCGTATVRSRIHLGIVDALSVAVAPTIPPGVDAPLGSLASLSTGGLYQKTGAPSTAWTLIGAAPIGGASNCLVFRPGSLLAGPVIFDAWSDLMARLATLRAGANGGGCYTIQMDPSASGSGACEIPSGAWDLTSVLLDGADPSDYNPKTPVRFLEGATVPGLRSMRGLQVENQSSTTPIVVADPGYVGMRLVGTSLFSSTLAPVIVFSGGPYDLQCSFNCNFDLLAVDVQGTASGNLWLGDGCHVNDNAITVALGAVLVVVEESPSCDASAIQTPVPPEFVIVNETNARWDVTDLVSSDYTADVNELVRVEDDVVAFTITLPDIAGYGTTKGKSVAIKRLGSGPVVTVVADGGGTVDGVAAFVIAAGANACITFTSDGVNNWMITAAYQ